MSALLTLFFSFAAFANAPELPLGRFKYSDVHPQFSQRMQALRIYTDEDRTELKRLREEGYACQLVDIHNAKCMLFQELPKVRDGDRREIESSFIGFKLEFGAASAIEQTRDLEHYKEWRAAAPVTKGTERFGEYLLVQSIGAGQMETRIWFGPTGANGGFPKYSYYWKAADKAIEFGHEIRERSPRGYTTYLYVVELK